MNEFVAGQRWVVDSEPELGLGTVIAQAHRSVTIFFEQGDCERHYAIAQAPLTRIKFAIGDQIQLRDGQRQTVAIVHEQDGLLVYGTETDELVAETALSGEIQLNQPYTRLLMGQLDTPKWFYFRRQLDLAVERLWQSRLNGLLGARANLIPHQLYVAWSACERERVRVLLADEVGLGKTIEAGLILTRLLKFERAQRTLILVPDALQVQWLIELVRKFQLQPTLYLGAEHEFDSGQIHIVPHTVLDLDSKVLTEGEFDTIIVDEAHHLQVDSEAFKSLSALASTSTHMILLTATPEQLGIESHFARLKLLDPAKFSDIEQFMAQERAYIDLNQKIRALPNGRDDLLKEFQLQAQVSDEQLINQLLDCHGIGRVMMRNARKAVQGFAQRVAVQHHLEEDSWNARFDWLAQWCKNLGDAKILVICHAKAHAQDCENYLWQKHGISAALFHEDQSLIERDRAAAYFADNDSGSQLLICSEIGSEGRNFQFCSHLVCLDLPNNPDLLEQRIGRLDRIGQKQDVRIHIPFATGAGTAQQFAWYHQVLNCIEQPNPAASTVHEEFWPQLNQSTQPQALMAQAQEKSALLQEEIEQGRDKLLELNSCRQPLADQLQQRIASFEEESPLELVEMASDLLQFHFEATMANAYSLIPADKMLIPALPGIPPGGCEVTFSRALATQREDLVFLSWDSPFILGLWELLHHSELGSASVATLNNRQLPEGHCLLETCFDLVIQSPHAKDCLPFLPQHSFRSLILDVGAKDLAALLPEKSLENSINPVKLKIAREIIKTKKNAIPTWQEQANQFAEQQKDATITTAIAQAEEFFNYEIERLQQLAQKNTYISAADIQALEKKQQHVLQALEEQAYLQLSSIRLIVITAPDK